MLVLVQPTPPVFDVFAKVRRCLALAEISEKAAALEMGIDPAELSRQLAGLPGHHLSFPRLLKLPANFWNYLLSELAHFYGRRLEEEDAGAAFMADVLEVFGRHAGRFKMASADVNRQDAERKRA